MPAPRLATPFARPRVVIGEGRDDFFKALVAHLGLKDVQVEEYGGKAKLADYLREFSVRPGHQSVVSLGSTRDADASVAQVFQSICSLLGNNGPPAPVAAGQIATGSPRIGVFILPDNQRNGMLEDLCLDAVQTDGAFACVDDIFQCVRRKTSRQPSPMAKARVHAWLASQDDPQLRLREAALSGCWPWGNPGFQPLIQFLHAL